MSNESGLPPSGFRRPEAQAVVALYNTHENAQEAIHELEKSGCDLHNLSIIGRDYYTEEGVVGYSTTGEQMTAWGKKGAFWCALWERLAGSGFFLIPGIGPLFVAGPVVGQITQALDAAAGVAGLSALAAALYSLGVPTDRIADYEAQVRAGKFILIVQRTPSEALA